MRKLFTLFLFLLFYQWLQAQTGNCEVQPHPMPVMRDSIKSVFESHLAFARSKYNNDSTDAEHIIWLGRRLAYLGHYRQAIDVYSRGIQLFPNDARFLRHRGHRYITVRCFDHAIADLKKAAFLVRDRIDEIEEDGIPNAMNIPTSTLHANIWYHLGLAYYVQADYTNALEAYKQCMEVSDNNDMYVATANWLYITYKKLGREKDAAELLLTIRPDMELIENRDYLSILLLYKYREEKVLLERIQLEESLGSATLGFGLGNYYLLKGEKEKAKEIFEKVVSSNQWAGFGFIAAEAELKRLK